MDRQQWREAFARVEERLKQHLDKLREHNEQVAEMMRAAERRRSEGGGEPPQE
jgi:hypothetical protein